MRSKIAARCAPLHQCHFALQTTPFRAERCERFRLNGSAITPRSGHRHRVLAAALQRCPSLQHELLDP